MTETKRIELAGYLSLMACLGVVQFTIFGANLIVIPGLLWLVIAVRERRFEVPAFFWPLLALAAWTLLSCAFSLDPVESFRRSRQLLLFLIVPMTARLLRGEQRAMTALNVIIALGAANALVGIVEYVALGFDQMENRPKGTLGHYMTYSGILMLVTGAAAARLIYHRKEWLWPAIAMPSLLVSLFFTMTRNVWIGTGMAISALLATRQLKLLILAPVAAVVLYAAAPPAVQQRALSIFDPSDATNRDRIGMLQSGAHMVRDYPVFGLGLNLVKFKFPEYRTSLAVDPADAVGVQTRVHLHNVPMQIAAERGLPALAAWLWFVIVAGRDLFRQLRRGPAQTVAAAGAAALIGMFFAGLFEHNFGDSEFLTLFLGMLTLPFAAAKEPSNS